MQTSKPKPNEADSPTGHASRDDTSGGRRAYVRYRMALDVILIAGDRHIPCQVRDFCMGGMLLRYADEAATGRPLPSPFSSGQGVLVRGSLPLPEGGRAIEFQARVARSVQDGIGVAFIDPDHDALRTMQQYALAYAGAGGTAPRRKGPAHLGRRFADIVAGCNRIVHETMDSLLAQLDQRLERHLFALSRDAATPRLESDFFTASELFRTHRYAFMERIRTSFMAQLQSAQDKALSEKSGDGRRFEELTLDDVSLINDEDLGVWLAVSEVTNKAEERYKEALALLEERLSVLFSVRIGHANNPYGPALFVESFQAGLGPYQFKEAVNAACYTLFKELLISLLADLYAKLNAILIDYGILPELKASMLHRPVLSKDGTTAQRPAPPAPDQAPRAARAQAAPRRKRQAEVADNPEELYKIVQDLRALRQELVRQRSAPGAGPSSGTAGPEPGTGYTTDELLAAISALQGDAGEDARGDAGPIKARVLAALEARADAGSGKRLSPRDSNLLEITSDLLGAMQSDPLVADSVKPWLRRLELPVVKSALLDPSLFFDHGHVVRQVVNNVAQLEYYRQGQGESRQNDISAAIEALLQKVAGKGAEGTSLFQQIQDRLDKLIKIQDQAYADNIVELTRSCQETPPVPERLDPRDGGEALGDAERVKWLLHARRLRPGDNLLQLDAGRPPQRLRVGWIDPEKTLFVLVNLRGISERVLGADDVAALMSRGVIEPQTNAGDPAMDRAQYVIMQDLYRQVLHESTHDGVTGLINRREFERVVNDAVAGAKREGQRHVMILADVDKFSAINTGCGYAGGDRLLQSVVNILRDGLPASACVARLGADQFGILLENCPLDDALAIAERQIEGVAGHRMEWKDEVYSVTLSMGLAPISARNDNVDELLHACEASCDIAKDMGGNRLQVYHAGHARIAHQTELMKWVGKIDKMLSEDELEIRCQRIQPLAEDGSESPHFEILLGVKDEDGKVNSPVEFIRAAEWYRRMAAVDRYVISRTLSWLEAHPEVVAGIGGICINLSGQSLNEADFFDFIITQLQAVHVPRDKICFEVTETVGIANLTDAALFIERVQEAGCRFSLDDFGSGMSSYAYLKHLPVDVVKIDGVFVQHLTADSSDYAVVKSVTEIAHFMNKKVVAEFVETAEALELLREIGVDYVQGFLIDRPGSIDRLLDLDPPVAAAG